MYEFDLKTLFKTILNSKKRIAINCGIALLVGIIISFSIPKEYVTSCSLAPESQEAGVGGGLSSLASIAGININGGTDAIGPDLYPDVVTSNKFIIDLLYVEVETINGDKMTYYDYLTKVAKKPWWNVFKKAFVAFMKTINPQPTFTGPAAKGQRLNPERMSREEESLVKGLKSIFGCSVSEVDNTISISAQAQDPLVAKILVDTASVKLQDFITDYRTNKARVDLEYYRNLEKETKQKYEKAQIAYANYCDSHISTIFEAYVTRRDELENEMSLAMNAYSQVKQQVQMTEAKVQEKTPVFTIIEKASVPNKHTSPRKMMIMFACVFLTFVFTLAWIYVKLLFFTKPEVEAEDC